MSVTIRLSFPAGRYHATPWGRHVNEGVPEWPPSPWRFLRALVAVWKRTAPEVPEASVRRLLDGLAHPPRFRLPPFRVAHTRHYMPWEKKKFDDRTLVFDTFVSINRDDPLYVGWPDLGLADDDRRVLELLLENLSTLGRAEGWVQSQLSDDNPVWNCTPAESVDTNPIPVFCPDRSTAFADSHYSVTNRQTRPENLLFDCPRWHLCLDTETIHEKRWSSVPGAKWINYTRPIESFASSKNVTRARHSVVTVARFRIDGPVLPLVTETLPLAERIRCQLLSECRQIVSRRESGLSDLEIWRRSPAFWGKGDEGRPGVGHRHAFFLPVDEDGDGRIDHVVVFAPMGLTDVELDAVRRVRRVAWGEGELTLLLTGEGDAAGFHEGIFREATVWASATPFVATRYPKRRGRKRDRPEDCATPRDFARLVLRQELARRPGLPEVVAVEDAAGIGVRRLRAIEFARFRGKRSDDGGRRPAGGFRIVFASPAEGPICLGHSCHFGLGLFVPE